VKEFEVVLKSRPEPI